MVWTSRETPSFDFVFCGVLIYFNPSPSTYHFSNTFRAQPILIILPGKQDTQSCVNLLYVELFFVLVSSASAAELCENKFPMRLTLIWVFRSLSSLSLSRLSCCCYCFVLQNKYGHVRSFLYYCLLVFCFGLKIMVHS